jgi:hypothetical protein
MLAAAVVMAAAAAAAVAVAVPVARVILYTVVYLDGHIAAA